MKRFVTEDVTFEITVIGGRTDKNGVLDCRNGHEIGDCYVCQYGCPSDFCQKAMLKAFPIMEAARAGGDLRLLGGESADTLRFCCPDGVVQFCLKAIRNG